LAYVRYTERPGAGRYLLVLLAFALGLMAKPMIVTLPFVLLLLDVWPLRRRPAILEKVPFFALSAAGAMVAYVVQQHSGAVGVLAAFPFGQRVENALVSYVVYIAKMFFPTRLAVFYPYPSDIPLWQAGLTAVVLAGISTVVLRAFRTYPYLAVGWLWYLVTLAPVIGVVQIGAQARADRYMYVPMVGLSIMLAWGAADWLRRVPRGRTAAAVLAAAACLCCAALARTQVPYWRNSESLFRHALAVTGGNYLAHNNLGIALEEIPGRLPEAIAHYQAALRINPNCAEAHNNLGNAWAQRPGRLPEAIAEYEAALRIRPAYLAAHLNLGAALMRMPGRLPEAVAEYRAALRLDPNNAEAHNHLGNALAQFPGRLPEAIGEYEAALRAKPAYAEAHYNLAVTLGEAGRTSEAVGEYEAALRANPDYEEAHYNLGVTLAKAGRFPEALAHFDAALRISPNPNLQRLVDRMRASHRP
jgi:tetratricopeptide (TPR) repeat protein